MSDPHRIRLQAAWDAATGRTTWTRPFGRPTGVGPADRIWLVIERAAPCAVALNGRALPPVTAGADAWRHDVTAALRDRNELRLEFPGLSGDGIAAGRVPLPERLGLVALEIDVAG